MKDLPLPQVVILGGGFGGLEAARALADAPEIRRRVLVAFEAAEREPEVEKRRSWLTFIVIGGGPTGVEMAGAFAEVARHTLARDFRHIDPRTARVILVEAGPRILAAYPPDLSEKAARQLEALGVQVWTGKGVKVEPDLTVPGRPEIFVIGDLAAIEQDGRPVPGVAPAAMQMGRHAGENLLRAMRAEPPRPFRYRDKGSLATIGRSRAVAVFGAMKLTGFVAWAAWLGIHIFFLIGFRNRFVVLFTWAWAYLTHQRSARLI